MILSLLPLGVNAVDSEAFETIALETDSLVVGHGLGFCPVVRYEHSGAELTLEYVTNTCISGEGISYAPEQPKTFVSVSVPANELVQIQIPYYYLVPAQSTSSAESYKITFTATVIEAGATEGRTITADAYVKVMHTYLYGDNKDNNSHTASCTQCNFSVPNQAHAWGIQHDKNTENAASMHRLYCLQCGAASDESESCRFIDGAVTPPRCDFLGTTEKTCDICQYTYLHPGNPKDQPPHTTLTHPGNPAT